MKKLFICLIAFSSLLGCQTSLLKEFEKLTPGMEKADVLEVMGSPVTTTRFHGKDRWFYTFYEQQIRFEKEVQFFEGKAVYVGEIWQPSPEQQAVAVDTRNAIGTEESKQMLKRDYQEYMEQAKSKAGVKYMPKFESVQ